MQSAFAQDMCILYRESLIHFPEMFISLLIFQDMVSVVIFSDIVFGWLGGGEGGFHVAVPWQFLRLLSALSSSELCDSISMQGTYNHVSLIRRE